MIELPEQVTVTMYKDKNGRLHRTQEQAINSDNYDIRLKLLANMKDLLSSDSNIKNNIYFRNDPSEMTEYLLDFLSDEINDVLPIIRAYVKVRKQI